MGESKLSNEPLRGLPFSSCAAPWLRNFQADLRHGKLYFKSGSLGTASIKAGIFSQNSTILLIFV